MTTIRGVCVPAHLAPTTVCSRCAHHFCPACAQRSFLETSPAGDREYVLGCPNCGWSIDHADDAQARAAAALANIHNAALNLGRTLLGGIVGAPLANPDHFTITDLEAAPAALASEPAQAVELPEGWSILHEPEAEMWMLRRAGVRYADVYQIEVVHGAVKALRAFADAIERGGKGAT